MLDMPHVDIERRGMDEDIINVHYNKVMEHVSQHLAHKILENGCAVS